MTLDSSHSWNAFFRNLKNSTSQRFVTDAAKSFLFGLFELPATEGGRWPTPSGSVRRPYHKV